MWEESVCLKKYGCHFSTQHTLYSAPHFSLSGIVSFPLKLQLWLWLRLIWTSVLHCNIAPRLRLIAIYYLFVLFFASCKCKHRWIILVLPTVVHGWRHHGSNGNMCTAV